MMGITSLSKAFQCWRAPEVFPGISRRQLLDVGHIRSETLSHAQRLFLFIKQVHGGGEKFAQRLVSDSEYMGKFLEDQESIFRLLEKLTEQFGSQMHVCLEGRFPSAELTEKEREDMMIDIDEDVELLNEPIQKRIRCFQELLRSFLDESMTQSLCGATYAIHHFMSGLDLHARKRIQRNQEFIGDYVSREALLVEAGKEQYDKTAAARYFAASLEDRNEAFRVYRQEIREGRTKDYDERHGCLADAFSEKVHQGEIFVTALGGAHSRTDRRSIPQSQRVDGHYVEDFIEKKEHTKVVTWEPRQYRFLTRPFTKSWKKIMP